MIARAIVYLIPVVLLCSPGCRTTSQDSELRIADGEVVTKKDPIATVTVALLNAKKEFACSGSLISDSVVLSAAHCDDPSYIRLGIADPQDANPVFKTIEVNGSDDHPCWGYRDFTGDRYGFDIKLVRLKTPVPSDWKIINSLAAENLAIPLETELVGAGFGVTSASEQPLNSDLLRKAKFTSKTDQSFSKLMMHMVGGPGRVLGRSLCFGDSGGPTFLVKDQKLIQVGINSGSAGDTQVTCMDGSRIVDLRGHRKWLVDSLDRFQKGIALEDGTPTWCTHVPDATKALKPFGDGTTGKGACRISITWDKAKTYLQGIGSGPDPSCPAGGGGGGGFAPILKAFGFSVSSPAKIKSAYLCDEGDTNLSGCLASGVKIPGDSADSGDGRECFTYTYQPNDNDRKGRIVLETEAGVVATDIKLSIGYLPCGAGGGGPF